LARQLRSARQASHKKDRRSRESYFFESYFLKCFIDEEFSVSLYRLASNARSPEEFPQPRRTPAV